MSSPPPAVVDRRALVSVFYDPPDSLGSFEEVDRQEMPAPYCELLAHDQHMTVTIERFHRSRVDVRVLDRRRAGSLYARKILLSRQSDGTVVQYGIMRIDLDHVPSSARAEIESERTPLGRVLIEHNVLRSVHLASLWRVTPGEELRELLAMPRGVVTFGRTAVIDCNREPAVELVEIVAPVIE